MTRTASLVFWIALLVAPLAHGQTEEEILERVRANATGVFLEQAPSTLPKSFHHSGLSPADKEQLIKQWASDSATCLADSLSAYADTTDVPLSKMVNEDGTFALAGDGSKTEFYRRLNRCMEIAWAGVGADQEGLAKHQ